MIILVFEALEYLTSVNFVHLFFEKQFILMSPSVLFSGYGQAGYALFVAVYAGLEVRNKISY